MRYILINKITDETNKIYLQDDNLIAASADEIEARCTNKEDDEEKTRNNINYE